MLYIIKIVTGWCRYVLSDLSSSFLFNYVVMVLTEPICFFGFQIMNYM